MDRKLRNRILLYLLLAGVLAYVLVELSGRKPVRRFPWWSRREKTWFRPSAATGGRADCAVRECERNWIVCGEGARDGGKPVKKGQVILELDVKDAAARLAEAKAKLLKAEDDLRIRKRRREN